MNITLIPEHELRSDLNDSYGDVLACEAALKLGITHYSGGSVEHRLNVNRAIIVQIEAELRRRGKASVVVLPAG